MKNLISIIIISLVVGCGQSSDQSGEKKLTNLKEDIKAKVMEVHDAVMPKMGELGQTAKALREKAAGLADAEKSKLLNEAADNIEAANEEMRNWMRNFDQKFEGSEEDVKQYMESQLKKINDVKASMNESIKKGKELLD